MHSISDALQGQRHISLHVLMFLQRLEMSQRAFILSKALCRVLLRTYNRLLPLFRENLGPAALVFACAAVGGVLLGPVGAIPG